jgi:acetate---CoA ligase (ADP-forming)
MMTASVPEIHAELRGGVRPLVLPRSLVVVGASERNTRPLAGALRGDVPVYAVNPRRTEVFGVPCYPSVAELPERPELALLLVGHERVEGAVGDALEGGVRSLVLPGLGAESGAAGPPIVSRVAALVEGAGAAFVGPNCMGVARPDGTSPWIGTVPDTFLPGHVSVVSQSGSVAEAFLACGPRVGFRCVVSSGGEASRDAADLLGFLAEDEGTRAIGLFLESVRRPAAFTEALRRCAEAEKPVVCLKVGRSDAAARATLAHTGAVVGSARAFSALLRRSGAIEVDDFHDLLETLEVLGASRRPRGTRVGAVSESGGECALLADHGEAAGLPFEPLPAELAARLTAEFPNYVSPENPLDAWAIADAAVVYPRSLELLAESGAFDILLAQVDLSQFRGQTEGDWCELIVEALADTTDGTEIFPAVTSVHASEPPLHIAVRARERGVPLLRGTEHGLRALAAVARWRPARESGSDDASIDLSDLLAPGPLAEHDSALALERYGVRFAPRRRAADPREAAEALVELGSPVVVKVDGPAHKAAAGGVVLGVESPEAASAAARRLGGRVLVARQLPDGVEAFCGLTRDPDFGPVLAVGLGGAAVEALALAAVCLAPVDLDLARELVSEAPGLSRLAGERAREDLARALVALGRLAIEHPQVEGCDVNPFIIGADGAVAVDALVVCKGGSP